MGCLLAGRKTCSYFSKNPKNKPNSLYYWVILHAFFVAADFFSSKINFLKNSFWNTKRVLNSWDTDNALCFVVYDLGPNCLQRLSADYPVHARQNVCHDLDPDCLKLWRYSWKIFFKSTDERACKLPSIRITNLTLKAPIATNVVCFSRPLKCLRRLYDKQYGPRSDCSYRSSLIWVHPVCFYT